MLGSRGTCLGTFFADRCLRLVQPHQLVLIGLVSVKTGANQIEIPETVLLVDNSFVFEHLRRDVVAFGAVRVQELTGALLRNTVHCALLTKIVSAAMVVIVMLRTLLIVVARSVQVILALGLFFANVVHWQVELVCFDHLLALVDVCCRQTIMLASVVLMVWRHPQK